MMLSLLLAMMLLDFSKLHLEPSRTTGKKTLVDSNLWERTYDMEVTDTDATGKETVHAQPEREPSIHQEAAITAAKLTVGGAIIDQLVSNNPTIENTVQQTVGNAVSGFSTSVVSEQLKFASGSDIVGKHGAAAASSIVSTVMSGGSSKQMKKQLKKVRYVHVCMYQ